MSMLITSCYFVLFLYYICIVKLKTNIMKNSAFPQKRVIISKKDGATITEYENIGGLSKLEYVATKMLQSYIAAWNGDLSKETRELQLKDIQDQGYGDVPLYNAFSMMAIKSADTLLDEVRKYELSKNKTA